MSRIVVPSLVQPADVAPQLLAQLEVDAGGRLVEDHERAAGASARARAAGGGACRRELRRAHVALRAQVEDVDHLLGALARVAPRPCRSSRRGRASVSRTVRKRSRLMSCSARPTQRARLERVVRLRRTRGSRPSVTRSRLQTALISVVLPAPLGPSRPKNAPAGISGRSPRARACRRRSAWSGRAAPGRASTKWLHGPSVRG